MMKKVLYMIIVSMITIGCAFQYGPFLEGKCDNSRYFQINQDSTFLFETYRHWWQWNSYGTWTLIPNKKNHILLKSSSDDYTCFPLNVLESKNEDSRPKLIFTQGANHYDCERNEVFVNGQVLTIDRDTIELSCNHIDSIMICLGFSHPEKIMFFSPHYYSICSQKYYPLDSANNVFIITIPEFPCRIGSFYCHKRYASKLFLYVPMETEAYYHLGKWFVYGKEGEKIPFKRYRVRKERKED